MTLSRVRLTVKIVLIALVIVADLVILGFWTVRPAGDFSNWLAVVGPPENAPIHRLQAWAGERSAPRTPCGLVSLFDTQELVFAGLLLAALPPLVVTIVAPHWGSRLGRWLASPVGLPRLVSFRFHVRAALVAIALLGLYLGWEIDAWRTWRMRGRYQKKAVEAATREAINLTQLRSVMSRTPSIVTDLAVPEEGYYRSKAALAAEAAVTAERAKRGTRNWQARIDFFAVQRRKYEQAAANPRKAVSADPPLPELETEPEREVNQWLAQRDYARSLTFYDELARAHPDYVEVHQEIAWLRATCPDARFRDGKLAVASARKAYELTNGKDTAVWSFLAAAYAESGDFVEDVKWQQKDLSLATDEPSVKFHRERLALYETGKPLREK